MPIEFTFAEAIDDFAARIGRHDEAGHFKYAAASWHGEYTRNIWIARASEEELQQRIPHPEFGAEARIELYLLRPFLAQFEVDWEMWGHSEEHSRPELKIFPYMLRDLLIINIRDSSLADYRTGKVAFVGVRIRPPSTSEEIRADLIRAGIRSNAQLEVGIVARKRKLDPGLTFGAVRADLQAGFKNEGFVWTSDDAIRKRWDEVRAKLPNSPS